MPKMLLSENKLGKAKRMVLVHTICNKISFSYKAIIYFYCFIKVL